MTPFISQHFATVAWIELLLDAVAASMAVWPVIYRRRPSMNPSVVEGLLERVHELRHRQFPTSHAHFKAIKTRAKLVAAARERLHKELFLRNRRP